MSEITAGLRIDVDTLRGTRLGVPNLVHLLDRFGIRATFFFSVGPDNMGRHLWRLLRPAFLVKMLRTRAASLYGWEILLKGTLWPGPIIGERCAAQIRQAADTGHEIGLHAWDHHRWQTRVARMSEEAIAEELHRGQELLGTIIGRAPDCAAAPGWRITGAALAARERFPGRYHSDCRGHSLFYPVVEGRQFSRPQVPTTLPTYDELIGPRLTARDYNDHLLGLFRPGALNVLTIHAEAEGLCCLDLFTDFLAKARQRGISFSPLGALLADPDREIPAASLVAATVPGREGWISCQQHSDA